jgi:hypothetical protein
MTDNDLAEIFACLIILIGGMRCFEWKYAVDHRLHLVGGDSLIHGDELSAATYGYRTDRGDGCKQDIDVDQGGRRGRFGRCNLTRRDRRADEGSSDQADLSFEAVDLIEFSNAPLPTSMTLSTPRPPVNLNY